MKKKNAIYLINSLKERGAEIGMELILNKGLLKKFNVFVVVLSKTNTNLEKRIAKRYNLIVLKKENFSNFHLLNYFILLLKLFKKLKPKLVISSLNQSVLLSRLLKLFKNFLLVNFEHSTKFRNYFIYITLKITDFLCNYFIVDSYQTGKFLIKRGKKNKKFILPLFFTKIKKFNMIKIKTIYCVGELTQLKNHLDILKTVHKSGLLHRGFRLVFFGEGEFYSQLEKYIFKNNLLKKVLLSGFEKKWQSKIGLGSIYISFSDYEGLSVSTLQAMEAGSCCLVRPTGEIKLYVKNKQNGIFINSLKSLEKNLIKIPSKKIDSISIGKKAYDHVSFYYSKKLFQKKLNLISYNLEKDV